MSRVQRLLAAAGVGAKGAVIVYKPANLFYLTGFTGEGIALLSEAGRAVITDFRYVEQAQHQCGGFRILSVEKGQAHERRFVARCTVAGIPPTEAEDSSRRKAEQQAAQLMLEQLQSRLHEQRHAV